MNMTKDSRKERMHVRDGNYMIENKADSKQSKGVPINDHPRHLSHTLGSFEPIAPHLPTPVAPFAGKSQQEIAATAAIYYGECTLQGINPREADTAAHDSQSRFQNWWLQARFKLKDNQAGEISGSDEENLPSLVEALQKENLKVSLATASRKRRRTSSAKEEGNIFNNNPNDAELCTADGIHIEISEENWESQDTAETDNQGEFDQSTYITKRINRCKSKLHKALVAAEGETTCPLVRAAVEELREVYKIKGVDCRKDPTATENCCLDGVWLTMSKPNYPECLGKNEAGEYMYTLGRMSFDMFEPTGIVCSIQAVFNPVFKAEVVPGVVSQELFNEVAQKRSTLRTYNIVTVFNIDDKEASATPVRGVMTTYSYMLPDPDIPNRMTVFFTGGLLEPDDDADRERWKRVFGVGVQKRLLDDRARALAAKVLLGASVPDKMEEDGSMSYYLKKPIGGHGTTFVDIIYLDDTLRVMQGQSGSLYIHEYLKNSHSP